MAESKPGTSAVASDAPPTVAEYKKSQQRVRELIERRRQLERHLVTVEDSIALKETTYLESTPNGNIISGFDNYMKGQSGAAAQRRKVGTLEQNKVFSKSSLSYRPNSGDATTPASTPASHAPTPISTSFRDPGSAQPTPTAGPGVKGNKVKKKDNEDSENDSQTNKKRINFGAARK